MARPATAAVRLLTGEREPVRVATTGPINVDQGGLLIIDGVQTVAGDRVLVKDQADPSENGIRTASAGQWYRAADARTSRTLQKGTSVKVQEGTVNNGKEFQFTALEPQIGDDAITVVETLLGALPGAIRDYIDAPVYVADRTALKALDTTKDKVAFIWNEGLRNGRLTFGSTNLSSQVAADTNQYTYVAPTSDLTGASGAWVYDSGLFVGAFPAPATRSERSKLQDRADLRDWNGLDLTGATDMASIVQAAINATAAAGVKLRIPGGVIKLGSTITVPQYANIEGVGNPATGFSGAVAASPLTFFHLAHLGVGFDLLGLNDGPRRVAGIGTYRDQTVPGAGWTPIAASADIRVRGCYDVMLEGLFLYNPTTGIQIVGNTTSPGYGSGRVTIRHVRGQPLTFGVNATHVYDTIYLDDIHWWYYWSQDANVKSYMNANAKSLIFGRVDWPMIGRVFSYGMQDGLYIQNQASVGLDGGLPGGTTTHLHADTLGVDNCQRGITTDAAANGATASIDRLTATNTTVAATAMLTITGINGVIGIGDIYGGNANYLANVAGSGNNVRIGRSRSAGISVTEFNVATGNELTIATKPITSAPTVYAFAGTGRLRTPDWVNFTPTVSASSGTITTVATIAAGDCKYKLEGTTCTFDYTFTITTNGTGAGTLQATLPFSAKKADLCGVGRSAAVAVTGLAQTGGTARLDILKYDGTYPGADATTIRISGCFDIA